MINNDVNQWKIEEWRKEFLTKGVFSGVNRKKREAVVSLRVEESVD